MVQEYHRRYLEEGVGKRDIVIVAHGHLNRVLIARWLQLPIGIGEFRETSTLAIVRANILSDRNPLPL